MSLTPIEFENALMDSWLRIMRWYVNIYRNQNTHVNMSIRIKFVTCLHLCMCWSNRSFGYYCGIPVRKKIPFQSSFLLLIKFLIECLACDWRNYNSILSPLSLKFLSWNTKMIKQSETELVFIKISCFSQ